MPTSRPNIFHDFQDKKLTLINKTKSLILHVRRGTEKSWKLIFPCFPPPAQIMLLARFGARIFKLPDAPTRNRETAKS